MRVALLFKAGCDRRIGLSTTFETEHRHNTHLINGISSCKHTLAVFHILSLSSKEINFSKKSLGLCRERHASLVGELNFIRRKRTLWCTKLQRRPASFNFWQLVTQLAIRMVVLFPVEGFFVWKVKRNWWGRGKFRWRRQLLSWLLSSSS